MIPDQNVYCWLSVEREVEHLHAPGGARDPQRLVRGHRQLHDAG